MIKEAIDRIIEIYKPESLTINERQYTSKQVYPVKEPVPEVLEVHTLTGLAGYINDNLDVGVRDEKGEFIHVVNPTTVEYISLLYGDFWQRATYLRATCFGSPFHFGQFFDLETFTIQLQSKFVQDETTATILKIIGNLRSESGIHQEDNGITQTVTVKTGIAKVGDVNIPNPVTLRPYRTFLEVTQPASQFVFRMKINNNAASCALFEADGEAWKNEAINTIEAWLKYKIEDATIIA